VFFNFVDALIGLDFILTNQIELNLSPVQLKYRDINLNTQSQLVLEPNNHKTTPLTTDQCLELVSLF